MSYPTVENVDSQMMEEHHDQSHSLSVPTVEPDGAVQWHVDGELHRKDGPALVDSDGTQAWYQDGLRHREMGPAYQSNEIEVWYRHSEHHRVDGPASVSSDLCHAWIFHELKHRLDGPSCVYIDGSVTWTLNNRPVYAGERSE